MHKALVGAAVAAAANCLCLASLHSEESPTFQRIRQTGTIVLGYRDSGVPFSYKNDKEEPIGYSIDICTRIVEAIKAKLAPKHVDVTFKELTGAMRVPLVANGTVDMECGSTSNTPSRSQLISFSDTTFVASARFVTKKSAKLTSLQSLKAKRMSAVAGTETLREFNAMNTRQQIGMIVVPVKDHPTAFKMLAADEAESYGAIDTAAYSMVARSKSSDDYFISEPLSVEPVAIALHKNDAELKQVADEVITGLFKSGEINQLYQKWFESPLPRLGFNLKFPMGAALKNVIAHPTDSSNPNDYLR
jgi:glutamate/aspartate transport system substrate-binding protein